MAHRRRDESSLTPLPVALEALRVHLLPSPLLNALPTALQVFAHFQLVNERIQAEAARALIRHDEVTLDLESRRTDLEDQVALGALSRSEGRRLKRMLNSKQSELMLAFSLEFRKHVSLLNPELTHQHSISGLYLLIADISSI